MTGESPTSRRRAQMLAGLRARHISDPVVLSAFTEVPREAFVAWRYGRGAVYWPVPLPIGHGQTLSQPYIVARTLETAAIHGDGVVLDVGSGSGYQTALAAKLCRHVHAIERVTELSQRAERTLRELGIANASFHVGDGRLGLAAHAPYDAILVAATATEVPRALMDQLKDGGRLIIPVGRQMSKRAMFMRMLSRRSSPQQLYRVTRHGEHFERERLEDVYFVPFVGA